VEIVFTKSGSAVPSEKGAVVALSEKIKEDKDEP
jgi:hypothetical protein